MKQEFNSFVERYQLIYEKDPTSKVFAPLAEAYRRMGLLEEAIDLAERGVKKHPHFASGRVALGKCYAQRGEHGKAVEQLAVAVDLSPENLLAHQLLAECYSKLKKLPEALNAYKMVLFLNPEDPKAAARVRDLEAKLFADAKDAVIEEDFSMEKLVDVAKMASEAADLDPALKDFNQESPKNFAELALEREIALLDARLDRGDWEQGRAQLDELLKKVPNHPDLLARKNHLDEMTHTTFEIGDLLAPLTPEPSTGKADKLQKLLEAIENRRKA